MGKKILIIACIAITLASVAASQTSQESDFSSPGLISSSSPIYSLDIFLDKISVQIGLKTRGEFANERASEAVFESEKNNNQASTKAMKFIEGDYGESINRSNLRKKMSENANESGNNVDTPGNNNSPSEGTQQQEDSVQSRPETTIESEEYLNEEEIEDINSDTETKPQDGNIRLTVKEGDKMQFEPDTIEWQTEEELRITLENNGEKPHNLVFDSGTQAAPEQNIPEVKPGESKSITVTFDETGSYSFSSRIGKDYERGMRGVVEVN